MAMTQEAFDSLPAVLNWTTTVSLPAGGIKYQEADAGELGTVARVTKSGYEVVSPDIDTESVYRQYRGRVNNYLYPETV